MYRKCFMNLYLGLVLLGVTAAVHGQDPLGTSALIGSLDGETIQAIDSLDDPDWRRRESATLWLIESADRWRSCIAAEWCPTSAEARWRFERVRSLVDELASLPTTLRQQSDPRLEGRLAQLRDQTGSAFLDALSTCLAHPDTRVRSRAVEHLAETRAGVARLRVSDCATDPSARVRESIYDVARRNDRQWAYELVRTDLTNERTEPLIAVAARGAKSLGDPRIIPDLRRRFREDSPPHPEVILALVAFGRPEDSGALDVLLRSGEYRHVSSALDSLGTSRLRDHIESIAALLGSEHWDLRVRALRRIEEVDRENLPYHLLDLLDHADLDVYRFAVEHLVQYGGEDFLGDIEVSLRRWPLSERPFLIASDEGRAFPRPVPAIAAGALEDSVLGGPSSDAMGAIQPAILRADD